MDADGPYQFIMGRHIHGHFCSPPKLQPYCGIELIIWLLGRIAVLLT